MEVTTQNKLHCKQYLPAIYQNLANNNDEQFILDNNKQKIGIFTKMFGS